MEHAALEEETFAGPITWDFSPVKGMETYGKWPIYRWFTYSRVNYSD
jgi:hypothetical protein